MPTPANSQEYDQIGAVLEQLDSIVLGKPDAVRRAMATILASGHLLVEDIPGVGKTTLARALAVTLGLGWNRIQFTSDLLPADVIGISIFDVTNQNFRFHPGPVFTSLLLGDELNRAPPKTQSALLEAMEEHQVTVDGTSYVLEPPFFVIATQNPMEQLGVYPLPESQLDRFMSCIDIGYPDKATERDILSGEYRNNSFDSHLPVTSREDLLHLQQRTANIHASSAVYEYIQNLLAATRQLANRGECKAGLSPRAGLNLVAMSKAWALLEGRDNVLPEDVQAVFPSVAAHRLGGSLNRGLPLARELLSTVDIE